MSRRELRHAARALVGSGVIALVGLGSCSGDSGDAGGSSTATTADGGVGLGTLFVDVSPAGVPLYPCSGAGCTPFLVASFDVTVTNTGPELQDLRLALSVPAALTPALEAPTFEGGAYSGPTGALVRGIPWLPAGASVRARATMPIRSPYPATTEGTLRGTVEIETKATVWQYDALLAEAVPVSETGYLPEPVTPTTMDVYSASADGTYVYVSARPAVGDFAGQGGVYRVALADGALVQLATHALTPADTLPFFVDGATLYYVTHTTDVANTVLRSVAIDGTGSRATVPLPAGTLSVRAVAADATYLFLILETADHTQLVHRLTKSDLAGAGVSSAAMGTLAKNTLAVTSGHVVVVRTDNPAGVWRIDKQALEPTLLATVVYVGDEASVACDDTRCFYSDQGASSLFEVPLAGGTPVKRGSAIARVAFDGAYAYSGSPVLVRVGPEGSPPYQTLASTNVSVQALDATHVYFTGSQVLWRLHK